MTPELYKFVGTISGTLISLLLIIVGYFLNKHIKVIETLVSAVNSLNTTVKLMENEQDNTDMNLKEIRDKLEAHDNMLSEMKYKMRIKANLKPKNE